MRLVIALTLVTLVAAGLTGCIETAETAVSAAGDSRSAGAADARMTADETVTEDEGLGADGALPRYYAERVHTITGALTLAALPVLLDTSNGDVHVTAGAEGAWSLVATIRGYGATPEDARANRDATRLAWSIGSPGAHALEARVERDAPVLGGLLGNGVGDVSGALELTVPASVLLELTGDSSNGDLVVQGVRAASLQLGTSNGDVVVDAKDTRDAVMGTSNGDVDARIVPGGSGRIEAGSSNGDVTLYVPEGARFGYRASLTTSNGDAEVHLEDGRTSMDEDENAAFETTGYAQRPIRVEVQQSTSNGDVVLAPL